MDISGVAAIVTGGGSGLGSATARMLAAQGARVTIFDLDGEAGDAVAAEVGGRFTKVDITDEAGVAAALDAAQAVHGVARILVNCAGIAPMIDMVGAQNAPHPMDDFRRVIEINLVGSFITLSRFAARLVAADPIGEERGVIVNTASVAAYDGQIGQAAYAASKSGVVGMTLPLARELAQDRIRVVTIAPGMFWTPMMGALPQAVRDGLGALIPHPGRLGQPDEFAMLVQSIVTNPMLNGETIRLDGALRMSPKMAIGSP